MNILRNTLSLWTTLAGVNDKPFNAYAVALGSSDHQGKQLIAQDLAASVVPPIDALANSTRVLLEEDSHHAGGVLASRSLQETPLEEIPLEEILSGALPPNLIPFTIWHGYPLGKCPDGQEVSQDDCLEVGKLLFPHLNDQEDLLLWTGSTTKTYTPCGCYSWGPEGSGEGDLPNMIEYDSGAGCGGADYANLICKMVADVKFQTIVLDFDEGSTKEITLTYEVGKGLKITSFAKAADCVTNLPSGLLSDASPAQEGIDDYYNQLVVVHDIEMAEVAAYDGYTSGTGIMEYCQVVQLYDDDSSGNILVEEKRIIGIDFDLKRSFSELQSEAFQENSASMVSKASKAFTCLAIMIGSAYALI